jgi:hypothetical protein
MRTRIRKHLPTILVAVVAAMVTAGLPPLAAAVFDANNAHKVDGRHAVGAGASKADRAGKLVSTDPAGYLPNNIIKKALNAQKLGGLTAKSFRRRFARVVVVAKSGGDFTTVQGALTSISGASASKRYLVFVAPGTYVEQVQMNPYVDLMGSGRDVTTITCSCAEGQNSNAVAGPATLHAASGTRLSALTVENTGGDAAAEAVAGQALAGFTIEDARLVSTADNQAWGGYFVDSQITVRDTDIDVVGPANATTFGIQSIGTSTLDVSGSNIRATGATTNVGISTSSETRLSDTRVKVSAVTLGSAIAVDVFGSDLVGTDLDLVSEGDGDVYMGLRNQHGDVQLSHSRVRAAGPVSAYAIMNISGAGETATLEVLSTRVFALAGTTNIALYNGSGVSANSQARVVGSFLKSSGGSSSNVAVYSAGAGDVKVDTSRLEAIDNTVFRNQGTVEVGGSMMAGGPVSGTSVTCAQVYDEAYVASDSTCP